MASRNGSAARSLDSESGSGPANVRSLLATGPVRNPRARPTDVHRTVAGADRLVDDDDFEPTLTWEPPPVDDDAIEVEIDLCELEDPQPTAVSANEGPARDAPAPAPATTGRIHLAIGGLGLLCAALAFVVVGQSRSADPSVAAPAVVTQVVPAVVTASAKSDAVEPVLASEFEEVEDVVIVEDDDDQAERPRDRVADRSAREAVRSRRQAVKLEAQAHKAMQTGQREVAIDLYRQALALDASRADSSSALSDVYFDRGRFDFAVAYAEDAVKADFNDPDHHIRLGDAYVRIGAVDDAREQYRTARQLGSKRAGPRLSKLGQPAGR